MNTPEERNLTPAFISSIRTFSPSSVMAVRPFTSITRSRPSKSVVAFRHALCSSAVHGAMSLPSTTNRRCVLLSMIEIFNIVFALTRNTGKAHTKLAEL